MTSAQYLFRLDDITPTMHWGRFWAVMALFRRFKVRPLLGIVPDNQDPSLMVERAAPDFWKVMQQLRDEKLVDISQHGYQHTLSARPGLPLIGRSYGIKEHSEFAGDSYGSQLERIDAGQKILETHNLGTSYFMAPNHSFDVNTLRALKTCGFSALSDGISLFPFRREGLTFVPQQLWRPAWLPCGTITVCLHSNELRPHDVKGIREFLRSSARFTDFESASHSLADGALSLAANHSFKLAYLSARALKNLRRPARPESTQDGRLGRNSQSLL